MLFENSFTCQPVCGPARAYLQTGQFATENRCYWNGIALKESTKTATVCSLVIILFAQMSKLYTTALTTGFADYVLYIVPLMNCQQFIKIIFLIQR